MADRRCNAPEEGIEIEQRMGGTALARQIPQPLIFVTPVRLSELQESVGLGLDAFLFVLLSRRRSTTASIIAIATVGVGQNWRRGVAGVSVEPGDTALYNDSLLPPFNPEGQRSVLCPVLRALDVADDHVILNDVRDVVQLRDEFNGHLWEARERGVRGQGVRSHGVVSRAGHENAPRCANGDFFGKLVGEDAAEHDDKDEEDKHHRPYSRQLPELLDLFLCC